MADELYYQHGGQQYGPVTGPELKELAAEGKLLPDDLIWKQGMEKWVPARSAKGLFPPAPAPTSTATPNRGQEKESVAGDVAPAGKVMPPARTAKSAAAAKKTPQAEQPEPLPLPDEDYGPPPGPTRGGKAGSPAVLRAKELLSKGTEFWRGSRTPVKAGILSGAGVIVVLLILVPALLLSGGKPPTGGGSSSPGSGDSSASGGGSSSADVGGSSSTRFTRIELINLMSKTKYKDMDEMYQQKSSDMILLYDGNDHIATYSQSRRSFVNFSGVTVNVKDNHKEYSRTLGANMSHKTWIDKFGSPPEVEPCYEPVTKTFLNQKSEHSRSGSMRIQCKDGPITLFFLHIGPAGPDPQGIVLSPIIGLF